MQNTATNKGIKNSWSLLTFAKAHGSMQVGDFTRTDADGQVSKFKSCVFTSPEDGAYTFVGFSSKLGEMTPEAIAAEKDNLQVVQLEESDNYYLCKKSENAWKDVNLGI